MSVWLYILLVLGILLIVLVILELTGVPLPSTTPTDYTTDPIADTDTTSPQVLEERSKPSGTQEVYYSYKGLIREQAVCKTLEEIYKRGFPTVRPSWLINPTTKHPLEYDCYNSDLKLAAEHNGEHHYLFPNKYHKTEQEFLAQRARDETKRRISDEHGVYLLTVPYWVPTETIKDWVEYYCPERVAQREKIESLSPPKLK
jgi:hypothetical protein